MDYAKLRAAALRDGEDEEAVTVDTRALIDKVLARYSGEWTTLRELIQNAADAQATTVSVKWETLPSTQVPMPNTTDRSDLLKHTISNHTLRRLVVQNDGQPFTKTDWGRLKRIAEGNPDETKIGAFGVGFYSVFADCEEPFVSSGAEAMAFYWKGNALFTKKSQLPPEQAGPYTIFVLDNRNATTPVPNLLSISQFLATSLTFVALQNIEFWIDDYKVLSLRKKTSPSVDISLPRDLEASTKDGLMKVAEVGRTSTQIDATFMSAIGWKPKAPTTTKTPDTMTHNEAPSLRSFFARLTSSANQVSARAKTSAEDSAAQTSISEDVTKENSSTIFLRATTANIRTSVASSFATELERATKKPPPRTTKISILTSSYDEAQATEESMATGALGKATDVFASVLPSKKPGGRIFIGFPTMQTTGAGLHVSAPSVIPTVEREAIDLNARWIRTWNTELLRAAGIVTRLAYAHEMDDLSHKLKRFADKGGRVSNEVIAKFMPEALHILKTFTFGDSTPSGQVGQIIEEAFWTAFRKATIEMYSSRGVLQTSQIRLGYEELSKFVDSIPSIPKEMVENLFVKKLIDFGLITPITVTDIRNELEAKSLNKEQLIHFISWAGQKSMIGELDPGSRAALLEVAVGVDEDGDHGGVIALGSIQNYVLTSRIPANLPVPPTTIPFSFTATISTSHLQSLGWEPLEVVPWLRFILESDSSRPEAQSLAKSTAFAVQVLIILSKNWDSVNTGSRQVITRLLSNYPIMPTKMGMRKPPEAFFPSVKLFDDLPVIEGCDKVKDKFLVALGVRKTVDLDTIFSRLLNASDEKGQQKWSHVELIKYLASVQNDIPSDDLKKLRDSRICPAEAGPQGMESSQPTREMYKVSQLYEPKDSLRVLRLPILQWPGQPGGLRASSAEGRFLTLLGLKTSPSVPELVDMMASKDEHLGASAMSYFISNHHTNRYGAFDLSGSKKAFLPLQGSSKLVAPSGCYTNERASILGFKILRRDLHEHAPKFGVMQDPPMTECVNRLLANPPQDQASAIPLFNYFADRLRELGENNKARLRDAPIVPIARRISKGEEKGKTAMMQLCPSKIYLGQSVDYDDIFDFVDFGADANAFLFKCGAKSEPTILEVASMAVTEPARLLGIVQSPERYLNLVKRIADSATQIRRDRDLWKSMKSAAWLLAYKELAAPKGNLMDSNEDEDEAPIKQYQLVRPSQIVILDDIISFRLFKDSLVCAPEEDALEKFYLSLGSRNLSDVVKEDIRMGPQTGSSKKSDALRKHVVERTKLFLHEYANYRKDAIKHDAKWLDKNLRVDYVSSVSLRRTLEGQRQAHTEKRSAACAPGTCTLYVADNGHTDMYQVGQAICQMLLDRPNQQAYLFFEPFLNLDLYELRARGYNVDRILRAKAAEARVAEEERRKALEEEQRLIKEREKTWARHSTAMDHGSSASGSAVAAAGREAPSTPTNTNETMPGSWDSPEEGNDFQSQIAKRGKSLFSNFTKRLGYNTQDSVGQDQGQIDQPREPKQISSAGTGGRTGGRTGQQEGRVANPAAVQQNLLNAVNATRPHGSSSVFSQPTVNEVLEQSKYCDTTSAHNINFAAEASNGMKVYVDRNLQIEPSHFLSANISAINMFASLLIELANVYSLSHEVLHIFYDESGGTIAFNYGGSLFFNFRYYLQLHSAGMHGPRAGEMKAEAGVWWWVVIAHELAHNLETTHNATHSFHT